MQKWKMRGIELFFSLAITESDSPAVIPYTPSKTRLFEEKPPSIKRARSSVISQARLVSLIRALEGCESANIHTLFITEGGRAILDCSAPGHSARIARLAHSMSKTITSLAVGMLYDDEMLSLDTPVYQIFPEIPYLDKRFEKITVKHLLQMTSGVSFGELGSVTEDRWCEAFFSAEILSAPGEKFAYNSMNSYILCRIVERISGESVSDFLDRRLIKPLGITDFFWEKSPEGYEKGGFGVYASAESFAKIGELILGGGIYGSYRVISEEYLKMATEDTVAAKDGGDFEYGYHIWVGKDKNELLINGLFGQNVWIYKPTRTVAVINAANKELFSESEALFIVRNHLKVSPTDTVHSRADGQLLKSAQKSFFEGRRFAKPRKNPHPVLSLFGVRDRACEARFFRLFGEWAFPKNNKGILPLTVSVIQNNFSGGILSLGFSPCTEGTALTVREKNGTNVIKLGFYKFLDSVYYLAGEKYLVRGLIEADGDGYKIELVLPELPADRRITVKIEGERLLVSLSELPGEGILERFLSKPPSDPKIAFIFAMLEKRLGAGFARDIVKKTFSPSLAAMSTKVPGYRELLEDESALLQLERESSRGFLISLFSTFVADTAEGDGGQKEKGGLLRIVSGLFGKKK